MAYYVFDDAKNLFEGMTREEIVNAIASATGVDPSEIDGDVITSAIKEKKAQQNVSLWVGTQNEYNAIATPDENTLYIVTDPHETNELQAQIDQLEAQVNEVVANGLQIDTQTASVTPDGSNTLEYVFSVPANITILEVAYKPNEIVGAAWIHEGIQIDVIGTTATLRVYNYTASATATFKIVYSSGGGTIDEVVDIRVGTDGTVYNTAGEAVRKQIYKAGFNEYVKQAFLNLLRHVAYTDENGRQYYDQLEAAMFMEAGVTSINAVFNQGQAAIYETDSLDTLRQYLTVTANYEDQTSAIVTAYVLTGTLEVGTSTITVGYQGKTADISVVVTEKWSYSIADLTKVNGPLGNSASATCGMYLDTEETNPRRSFVVGQGATSIALGTSSSTITAQTSDYYPIKVPAGATKVTLTPTPATQYVQCLARSLTDGVYSTLSSSGWSGYQQGGGTKTFAAAAGDNAYIFVTLKYDNAGTSYPSEPTGMDIVFSDQ